MRKIILGVIIFVLFFITKLVSAEVIINEVQIKPTEDRFIELYNTGSSSVDLTNWYIQRKTETGSDFGSLITKTNFEGKTIPAGGYFLIAKSKSGADITLSTLTLTESNIIQLKNSDGDIVDKIGWGNCNDNCVAENPVEGKSIQKQGSDWLVCDPSPGSENSSCENTSFNNSNNNSNSDENNESSSTNENSAVPKIINSNIKAKIISSNLAFTGEPLEIDSIILGLYNETLTRGKIYWSFGDGASLIQSNKFEKISHIYDYPGEYILYLDYYPSILSSEPEAFQKMTIKVIPTTVVISKIGDAKDFFIELTNNASSEMNVSAWTLRANGKIFTLPEHTIILPKKHIILSPKITNFQFIDQYSLKLYSSTGELIFDYNNIPAVPPEVSESKASEPIDDKVDTSKNSEQKIENDSNALSVSIPKDNLIATAVASSPEGDTTKQSKNNSYIFIIIFILLLLISSIGVYFMRQKKIVSQNGDDFDIIDE